MLGHIGKNMKGIFTVIIVLNVLSSSAQTKGRVLRINDSNNSPLGWVTGIYLNKKGKEIVSARSNIEGNIFLSGNYEKLSLRLIGYKDLVVNLNELTQDTTSVTLEAERYQTPTLIINKATLKHDIDYSDYVGEIIVKRIDAYEVSSDTTYFDDGTIDYEITDSLRINHSCKIAIPNKWDSDYKNFYKLLSNKLVTNSLATLSGDKASVDFQISKTGEMIIESINGFQGNSENWLISYLESWKWQPSDLYGKKVDTKHKMLILIK